MIGGARDIHKTTFNALSTHQLLLFICVFSFYPHGLSTHYSLSFSLLTHTHAYSEKKERESTKTYTKTNNNQIIA